MPGIRHALAFCGSLALALPLSGCDVFGNGDAPRDANDKVTSSATANAMKIRVGDCLQDPGNKNVTEVVQLPCEQPHSYEAFDSTTLSGNEYPGEPSITTSAKSFCKTAFEKFVGRPFDNSELQINYLYPTDSSWASGDRTILCLIADKDHIKSTGSLNGAAR